MRLTQGEIDMIYQGVTPKYDSGSYEPIYKLDKLEKCCNLLEKSLMYVRDDELRDEINEFLKTFKVLTHIKYCYNLFWK